jgi:TatD DNase family protein
VAIGTTADSSLGCAELAAQYEMVYASTGIHPNYCQEAAESDWRTILELVERPKVVAIGETGLDRHWDYCPFDVQCRWFDRHIELSIETGLPLVIHMRDCEQDILRMLRKYRGETRLKGIMHSFTGQWETAAECLDLGLYISFAGMLTFTKSTELRAIAAKVPSDRLLIETDSPYLSPHPCRARRPNEPALIRHTAECLAEVRQIDGARVGEITTDNARRIFQLD